MTKATFIFKTCSHCIEHFITVSNYSRSWEAGFSLCAWFM